MIFKAIFCLNRFLGWYTGPKAQQCQKWLGESAKGVLVYVDQKHVALVQERVALVQTRVAMVQ